MDPISINRKSDLGLKSTSTEKENQNVQAPVDSFTKTGMKEAYSGSMFTALLDMRVPTLTKSFPAEERDKVLSLIQPGDVILETNDAYPGWQLLENMVFGSQFTHAAIYEGEGKFLEATTGDPSGKGVVRTDLKEYLQGRIKLEVIRPPYKTPEDKEAALKYAREQLGKPYDSKFNQKDDEELYCAELVQRALEAGPNPIKAPITSFFGKKSVGPNAFQEIPGAQVVYTTGASFLKARLSHAPFYIGGMAGAVAGGMTLGPLGAVAGFALGGLVSILTGNKIQAGKFSLFPE